MKIKTITTCAVFAALMCICAPLSIPIGPVPVSLTNLIIYFALMILGTKEAFISYAVYLLLGMVGLPVFAGYKAGVSVLAGPTGGYLVGFLLLIPVAGIIMTKTSRKPVPTIAGMILGTMFAYIFGTVWFVILMKCEVPYALTLCVWPFIPFDLIKMVLAVFAGRTIRKSLRAAGVLEK